MEENEKKEYTEEELKRHVGALSEKYQDDIKVTRESIVGITQILGRIEKTLDGHTEEIGNLMVDITSVKSDVKELRADMIEVKSDLKQIKFDVKTGLENKVDKKNFINLDGRIRKLETKT